MLTPNLILGPHYDQFAEQIEARLQPVDSLEVSLTAQIVRAHWRPENCEKCHDPNSQQIDRLRNRAESSIRRNMAEFRQLQADRHLKAQLNLDLPGITRVRDVLQTTALSLRLSCARQNLNKRSQSEPPANAVAQTETKIAAVINKEQELHAAKLKKRSQLIGRNAPCPCGSRLKHKRCCGKNAQSSEAPPVGIHSNAA